MKRKNVVWLSVSGFLAVAFIAIGAQRTNYLQTGPDGQYRLAAGGQVIVRGQQGKIMISGWEQDTVQATGRQEGHPVNVNISQDSSNHVVISTDPRAGSDVDLDIKLPRQTEIKLVETQGDVEVSGIKGAVGIRSSSGNLKISRTGALSASTTSGDMHVEVVTGGATVTTQSGNITVQGAGAVTAKSNSGDITVSDASGAVSSRTNSGRIAARNIQGGFLAKTTSGEIRAENVRGLIDASSTSQEVHIRNAESDVRAMSISGNIQLECVKGRAESNTVSGSTSYSGVSGDAEANSTSGDITFRGSLRSGGHYRLKSFSGGVRLETSDPVPGFTATLSSYDAEIETDFALQVESPEQQGHSRRLVGRYGDGQTQISLDSFSGTIQLKKVAGKIGACK